MRRMTFTVVAILALAAMPALAQTPASIGPPNYHYETNMNCSDCHSMHASAHNNLTDGAAILNPNTTPSDAINPYYPAPNPGPGRQALLKADDVCATCHDGKTWAPDVIGDNINGYVRSAGGVRDGVAGGGHKLESVIPAPPTTRRSSITSRPAASWSA